MPQELLEPIKPPAATAEPGTDADAANEAKPDPVAADRLKSTLGRAPQPEPQESEPVEQPAETVMAAEPKPAPAAKEGAAASKRQALDAPPAQASGGAAEEWDDGAWPDHEVRLTAIRQIVVSMLETNCFVATASLCSNMHTQRLPYSVHALCRATTTICYEACYCPITSAAHIPRHQMGS